jgi:hypothetical protein
LRRRLEIDITYQSLTRLLGGIGNEVGTNVDDDGTLLKPLSLDEMRHTNGGDDNISPLEVLLKILCLRMADSNGGVGISQKVADRATNNVASAYDNGVLAGEVDTSLLQQDHDTFGCAWDKERLTATLGQLANVAGAEAIDVLLIGNGRGDGVFRDVLGEGKLDQDTVDGGIVV